MAQKKANLKFRLMFWLTLVNLAACVAFASHAFYRERQLLLGGLDATLQAAAEAVPHLLSADYHEQAVGPGSIDRARYSAALQILTRYAEQAGVHYLYTFVRAPDGKSWHTAATSLDAKDRQTAGLPVDFASQTGWLLPASARDIPQYWQNYQPTPGMLRAVEEGKPTVADERDEFGHWRSYSVAVPLSGQRVFVAGADVDIAFVQEALQESLLRSVLIALVSFLLVTAICYAISNTIAGDIAAVAQETGNISQFKLNEGALKSSSIAEVDQLITAVEDMKVNLRSFGKYVPTALVRELITTGQEAKLGGHQAELTVFFSDIADFTRISEQMTPQDLVAHVGDYLGEMSDLILAHQGTVDKYIGDAVMAFWGAPTPVANHPLEACRAALACQARLGELRLRWQKAGKPDLFTRMGLHTGEMIVGNMGSENRLNYTVIGDAVNLSSRLEALNKYYGTAILISEATWKRVEHELLARPVDCVSVKGKQQGVLICELLAERSAATETQLRLAELATAAMQAYLQRQFAQAQSQFAAILALRPGDLAATKLHDRCQRYLAEPPPADWDGAWQMDSK